MRVTSLLAAASFVVSAAQPAAAALVNLHFSDRATQSGAALVGSAGDVWNRVSQHTGSAALVDARGMAGGVSVDWSAQGHYNSDASYTQFTGTAVEALMNGYLYSSGGPISVTFNGLAANRGFSLYAITQGDNNTRGRRNDLTVNGQAQSTLNSQTNRFVAGDNYALFRGVTDAAGRITITDTKGIGEANLNGFQLQVGAVPEPATWAMMIAGVGMIGGVMRRRSTVRTGVSFG